MSKPRFREMDVLKGILILLVVVGHLIPQFPELLANRLARGVLTTIYGFHMPAFVFVAGFCSATLLRVRGPQDSRDFLVRRARRLLLPYLTWGTLYFALRAALPSLAAEPFDWSHAWQFLIGYNPDGALWFLWALFTATVLTLVLLRPLRLGCAAVFAAAGAVAALATQPWLSMPVAVNELPLFLGFFLAGLWTRSRVETLLPRLSHPLFGLLSLVGFGCAIALAPSAPHHSPWFLPAVTSVTGTALTLFVSVRLARFERRWSAPLLFLSGSAMEIYILAEPVKVVCRFVFTRLGLPVAFSFPVMLVLMLSVPVVLARYLLRDRWTRLLLLGEETYNIAR